MRLDRWERTNARLFCEAVRGQDGDTSTSEQVLDVLEPVDAVARLVVEELDAQQLAPALARHLVKIFEVERVTVALGDETKIDHASTGFGTGEEGRDVDDATSTLLLWLARRQQYFLANDPRSALPFANQTLESAGWRNILALPVLDHRGQTLGAFVLVNRDSAPFTAVDLRLAEILARQASVGFERSLLIGRLDDWTRGLQALLSFSAEINQHLEPSALIHHLIEHAARFLKADGGLAGLKDGSGGAARMVSTDYWASGAWHEDPRSWRAGEGLPGHVLESEFPYLANEYATDPKAEAAVHQRFGVRHALCVPIKDSDDRPVGFFELHRGDGHSPFTWQDAAFLESLANTTAVAIENAQLLGQLEVKSQQVRTLSAENVNRLEEVRRHIARELHDEAGQALVGIKLGLKVMRRLLPGDSEAVQQQLGELAEQVDRATGRLKDLAQRLRPPILDRLGLDVALQQLADDHGERTGIPVELSLSLTSERQPAPVETAFFRIAQEALTNIANHAGAQHAAVRLEADEEAVTLRIDDDGCGFDPATVERGLGLLGMRERVSMLGGEFTVESAPGRGTRIHVVVPRSDA